jgi:hypothetical protein
MGHALLGMALPPCIRSIIPRGVGALGYTIQRPTEDRFLMSRPELQKPTGGLLDESANLLLQRETLDDEELKAFATRIGPASPSTATAPATSDI